MKDCILPIIDPQNLFPSKHTLQHIISIYEDEKNHKWFLKKEDDANILAEAASWLLAKKLKVPVPQGAICHLCGEMYWCSSNVVGTTDFDLSYAALAGIKNRSDLARILLLDIIVGNPDRHRANLLCQIEESKIWAIDFAASRIGIPEKYQSMNAEYVIQQLKPIELKEDPYLWSSDFQQDIRFALEDFTSLSLDKQFFQSFLECLQFADLLDDPKDSEGWIERLVWRFENSHILWQSYWNTITR